MLTSLRKFYEERGQGLTEYVLILAFVAVVAYTMFGPDSSLKSTVSSSFSESQSRISSAASNAGSTN